MKILIAIFSMILIYLSTTSSTSPKTFYYVFQKLNTENILFKLSKQYDIPLNLIHAIWEQESNKAIRSQRGKTGEYGPFQVLEIAAKDAKCKGNWKFSFPFNAECGVKYLELGSKKCGGFYNHRIATYYNTGKCRKKPNSYSQEVMKRMLKV